jgi:hypothetical protein
MNFYTYAYLREDGTPYYVGKGKDNRAYKKGKGQIKPPKDKSRIIFLKQNLTEEQSFRHEIYMIAIFGRKDLGTGILCNRTDGGEGTSGYVYSEERKQQVSRQFKGIPQDKEFVKRRAESVKKHYNSDEGKKTIEYLNRKKEEYFASEEGKKRLLDLSKKWSGKNNPAYGGRFSGKKNGMYGKKHTEEVKRKISEAGKGRGAKIYTFKNPNGEIVVVNNLTQFCKENNLSQSAMHNVNSEKRNHHKGWTKPPD